MKCETCEKDIMLGQNVWGRQVIRDTQSEFHYYCSEEHAEIGLVNLGYSRIIGEVTDVALEEKVIDKEGK